MKDCMHEGQWMDMDAVNNMSNYRTTVSGWNYYSTDTTMYYFYCWA